METTAPRYLILQAPEVSPEYPVWSDIDRPEDFETRTKVAESLAQDLTKWHGRLLVALQWPKDDPMGRGLEPLYFVSPWTPKSVKADD